MMAVAYDPLRVPRDSYSLHSRVASHLVLGTAPARDPEVSILIPTYRRPALLDEALASALGQVGHADHEVIVLDNDPDGDAATEAVVRKHLCPRLTYYRNDENLGMTGNWNRIIELARGKWITLLHDDDWLSPFFLQEMMRSLPPDAALMAAQARIGFQHYESGLLGPGVKPLRPVRADAELMVLGNISPAPGVLMRREVVLASGGYDHDFYPCADYDLYTRLVITRPAYLLPAVLCYYRNSDSTTFKGDTFQQIVRKSIWMKRGLLRFCRPGIGKLIYVESMRRWYRLAHANQKDVETEGGLDRAARGIALNRPLSLLFELGFGLARKLFHAWSGRGS
jgi:GT2 family glycosyltransferase